ncbi:MAG: carboxypeptidase regulatory-like domain-containing protein, partial [Gammaproteobacteria bacterium]
MRLLATRLLVILFAMAEFAGSQVTTANYYLLVTDPTGAVVPGATVILVHEGTGVTSTRTTEANGEALFDFLRVGSYLVRVEAKGFKRYESKGVELSAAQNVRQAITLQVGALTETVSVEANAPLVNTVSSEQLNTYDAMRVLDLPMLRRNYAGLLAIGTGVTYSGDSVRMNGFGKNGASFTVDGTDAGGNPEGRYSSNYLQPNLIDIMSIEAIQEVHTVKGVPAAEYGNMVAGQVNLLSRSGTNKWHGSLFENFRAEDLDARHQRLARKPGVTFNQFGGSLGGPIKRDRIFVFGVYEGYRERSFVLVQENVLTGRIREEMLRVTPSYRLLLDHLPLPTAPVGPTADVGLFLQGSSSARDDNHADVKGDIRFGSTRQLSLTYSRGRPFQLLPRHYLNGANDRTF